MLKFISEDKVKELFFSKNFLLISCSAIFLLSIFLRSLIDVGSDTGIYISLGKKISDGGRYYYDFFESNFPISFYVYALEYRVSKLFHIDPIITSEIVINLLGLLSIFWSARILAQSKIYQNKAHYNLIIIGCFLGFFLRSHAIQLGEFGTKTSFLLLLLFPYFCYSFPRKNDFLTKDLIFRGCLMGLMVCFKPHYIIFPLFAEFYRFWQKKSVQFFCELDKLIAVLIYLVYLFWMLKFLPEFFEMMVPMWMKFYSPYDNNDLFFGNFLKIMAAHIVPFGFFTLIFSRLKADENDKVLLVFFAASSLLFILENAMTSDQSVILYSIVTICLLKFTYDLIASKKIVFSENKFILISLFFIPIFDLRILPTAVSGLTGFANAWWIIAPVILIRKPRALLMYFILLFLAIMVMRDYGSWAYIAFNISALFLVLFLYEQKIYSKISEKFSVFSVVMIATSISSLLYLYVASAVELVSQRDNHGFPNKASDMINYYSKEFAPKNEDGVVLVSIGDGFSFSWMNYLKKENRQKFHIASIQATSGYGAGDLMFGIGDLDTVLVNYYLFDDIRSVIKNPQTKIILVNNTPSALDKGDNCIVGSLEYYFLDQNFRKYFFKNFRFENRVIIDHEVESLKNIPFITGVEASIFDKVTKSKEEVLYDIEVYIRKE